MRIKQAMLNTSRGHIANPDYFSDARLGSGSTTYSPDGAMKAGPEPKGAPRTVQVPGLNPRNVTGNPTETNKRF